MRSEFLRTLILVMCGLQCQQMPAFAQFDFHEEPTFAKDDPLASSELEIWKKLKPITFPEWKKLWRSAEEAHKREQFRESLKLYKEAEIRMDGRVLPEADPQEGLEPPGPDSSDSSKPEEDRSDDNEDQRFHLEAIEAYLVLAEFQPALTGLMKLLQKELKPESTNNPSHTIWALNKLIEHDIAVGAIEDADVQLARATSLSEKSKLIDSHTLTTKLLLANRFFSQSKFSESKNLFSEVERLSERLTDEKAALAKKGMIAEALDGLARIEFIQGQQTEALQHQQKSSALRNEAFGKDSLEIADSMLTLAEFRESTEPLEARNLRLNALAIQQKVLQTTAHPKIAITKLLLVDLAEKPRSTAVYDCESARSTVDGILNEDSPFYAEYLGKQAKALSNVGRIKPGKEKCQRAIALKTKLFGARSLSVATDFHTLALLQMRDAALRSAAMKKYENIQCPEAASSCRQAIAISDERLGTGNAVSGDYFRTLGWIERFAGNNVAAEENLKISLTIKEKYGANSATLQDTRKQLLEVLIHLKKIEEARTLAADVMQQQLKLTGVFDREVSELLKHISKNEEPTQKEAESLSTKQPKPVSAEATGGLYLQQTLSKPSIPLPLSPLPPRTERQALAENLNVILLQMLPTEDSGLGSVMVMLMEHYPSENKIDMVSLKMSLLDTDERVSGNDSPYIVSHLVNLAEAYSKQKKYSEARAAFNRAIAIVDEGLGSKHPELINVLTPYSAMLKASGDETEAAIQTARCAAIQAESTLKN